MASTQTMHSAGQAAPSMLTRLLTRLPAAVAGLVGAAVMLYGVRQTWISTFAGLITQSGWGTRNGDILVAGSVVAAVLAVAQLFLATTLLRWLLALTGFAAAGYAGYLLIQLYTVTQQLDGMVLGGRGPGLYVTTAGATLAFLTLFLPMPAGSYLAEGDDPSTAPAPRAATSLGSRLRYPAAALAVVAGLAHVPVTPAHLNEARYIGLLFILVTVVCVLCASWLLIADSAVVWGVLGVNCFLAALTYVVSRTIGLPLMGDDVGNWFETLGVISVVAEAGAVVLAASAIRRAVVAQSHQKEQAGPMRSSASASRVSSPCSTASGQYQ